MVCTPAAAKGRYNEEVGGGSPPEGELAEPTVLTNPVCGRAGGQVLPSVNWRIGADGKVVRMKHCIMVCQRITVYTGEYHTRAFASPLSYYASHIGANDTILPTNDRAHRRQPSDISYI